MEEVIANNRQSQMRKYLIKGLTCASCAAKIEQRLTELAGAGNVSLNFAAGTIMLNGAIKEQAQEIIDEIEPGAVLEDASAAKKIEQDNAGILKPIMIMSAAFVLLVIGLVFNYSLRSTPYAVGEYVVLLTAYFMVGWPVLATAARNIVRGNIFDENFLMTVATLGAIAIHQLPEAVGVMLFFYVGEFFQDLAVNRSRRSIKSLLDIRPEYANLHTGGEVKTVSPESVNVGERIVVKPGEKIPLDGMVEEGVSFLDTSALTGESVPRKAEAGKEVLAGMINTGGLLTIRVTKLFEESSIAKILDLVENAGSRKAPTEQLITKFSRYYTPAVVFSALALALIPPLVIPGAGFSDWIYRALILLVISCPCALVVSIPLGYFGGVGGASKRGVLVKGANFLEALTQLDTVVMDKTGTLTKGVFRVASVNPVEGFSRDELLTFAAVAESSSNHPIAKSILEAYQGSIGREEISGYEEIAGHGIKAVYQGRRILAGNERLLQREGVVHSGAGEYSGTVVYIAVDGRYAGHLIIADEIKADAGTAIADLKKLGIRRTIMLTGDDHAAAGDVAARVGIDAFFAKLLPEDKVAKVEELMQGTRSAGSKLAFVGDGINDAPVITRADIGIAMGGLGSDAAIEAADIVIMDDAPSKLAAAVRVARSTKRIVIQNIILALGIKGVILVLGALGTATMWEAVFADAGVALLAVLNSTRALR